MRESDIEVSKERIENSGLYHFNIKIKDIDSITLVNELPKFVLRTNGFDVGIIKKGFLKPKKVMYINFLYVLIQNLTLRFITPKIKYFF